MSARTVIEHALLAYYADSADSQRVVDLLLAQYDDERHEKDTRGSAPHPGESTHRHPRPCEFPTIVPCQCPRPSALSDAAYLRARRLACVASFFRGARDGRAAVWARAAA